MPATKAFIIIKVFIYCRVSTDDQEDNTSLEQQELDAREYCERNGFIVAGVFREVFTGSVWRERGQFMEMRKRYLDGEVQGVVVRTYSRFTRMIADYFVLTQEMREHNIRLFCVKEQYDDSPLGRMLQAIQMGFNEQERETTRQRTIDGKRARVTNKKLYLTGKKPPYGLKFDDEKVKGKLVVYEDEAEVARTILRMRAEKVTIYTITKYLNDNNIPSPNAEEWTGKLVRIVIERGKDLQEGLAEGEAKVVREILHMYAQENTISTITKHLNANSIPLPAFIRKEVKWNGQAVRMIIERAKDLYVGVAYAYKYEFTKEYRDGKQVTVKRERPEKERLPLPEGTVPRIIDDETARLALAAAEINAQDSSRNSHAPELSLLRAGFIKCGVCGGSMSVHAKKTKKYGTYLHYRCNVLGRADRGDHEHIEISLPKIDKIVWDYVCGVLRDLEIFENAVNTALEMDMFSSPEKAALKTINECKALIEQYREDLKTTGLSKHARAVLLEDLSKQTDLLEDLEKALAAIQSGKIRHEKVIQEYRNFVQWCQEFKKNGQENAAYAYKEKRDALRFLGVMVYIYKDGTPEGRYTIRLAPPELIRSLKLVPKNSNIGGTSHIPVCQDSPC